MTSAFKPGRDGEPVPWQPCCDPYRREVLFVAAVLYIAYRKRRKMIRRILVIIAAPLLLTLGIGLMASSANAHTIAPNAGGCVTGPFDLSADGSPGYNATGQGHNNPVQMVQGGASDFCLQDNGGGWYTFEDIFSGECLNMASNGTVYEDSCIFSTPEQWNQSIPGDHHWENRHNGSVVLTGGDGGPPYGSAVFTLPLCTGILCGSTGYFQSWATPGS